MVLKMIGAEPKKLELQEGLQQGQIKKMELRQTLNTGFTYIDIFINLQGDKGEIKASYPAPKPNEGISMGSLLGDLVSRFTGTQIIKGKEYDLEYILLDKPCQFLVLKNKQGYYDVLRESVKPIGIL